MRAGTVVPPAADGLAAEVVTRCAAAGLRVAVAESLTAGQVCAAIADVPGASQVLRGGVVAYATDLKASILGVDAALLAARGPVDAGVARAMALGVRRLMGSDVGVATTGVAGPQPQGGAAVGTVFVAVSWEAEAHPELEGEGLAAGDESAGLVSALSLPGDRAQVRAGATASALELLIRAIRRGGEGVGARGC